MAKFHSNLMIAGLALASLAAFASTSQEPTKKESVALENIKGPSPFT